MPATEYGRSGLALLTVGSGNVPRYCEIGSGSGTFNSSLGSLYYAVGGSRADYTSRDISTVKQVNYTWDFSSTKLSGLSIREFGVGVSGALNSNDLWMHEHFPVVTFDGSVEAQVQVTLKYF